MTSLIDAMQLDFDKSQLATESDAALTSLQLKIDNCVASWDAIGRALLPSEIAFVNALHDLTNYIGNLLTTRYGCND